MPVEYLILLFAVATAVAVGARWLRLPYTIALVVAGLVLGTAHLLPPATLTRDVLFSFVLPALIFEAAFHLDAPGFWRDRIAINAMATPGLVVATALTAAILVPLARATGIVDDFGWIHALVFASVIAATDPIAVVGLFKQLGAPRRLSAIVEAESLLNDGTGVVIFTLAAAAAAGEHTSLGHAVLEFVRVAGLGALVGAAVGYVSAVLIRRIDDAMVELTLTVLTAYGAFTLAERLGVSGVIATVVAGMLCGNYSARVGMSPTTRVAVETFWEYAAFALNSVVFLLIGLEVNLPSLLSAWKPILAAYVAMMAARAVVVFVVTALLRPTRWNVPWPWAAVITWSGLRGALSMVLVLGLPRTFPHRELFVTMTFGVVLLSILVQGLSMGPLLRKLGLAGRRSESETQFETELGRYRSATAALHELDRMDQEHGVPSSFANRWRDAYRKRATEAEAQLKQHASQGSAVSRGVERAAVRRLLLAERAAVVEAAHGGLLGHEARDALIADVDARVAELEDREPEELADATAARPKKD